MADLAEHRYLTADDYLAGEAQTNVKHESVDGLVYALAGADEAHATVALNLASMLKAHLRGGPCRVYISDIADAERRQAKEEAQVVIEVFSDSTEG